MPKSSFVHESTLPAAPARALSGQHQPRGLNARTIAAVASSSRSRGTLSHPDNEASKNFNNVKPSVLGDAVRRTLVDAESFIGKLKERAFIKPAPFVRSTQGRTTPLQDGGALIPNAQLKNDLDDVTKAFQYRLSHQLESLTNITRTLRSNQALHDNAPSLLKTNCKNFVVGKLSCASNSTTEFFNDRVEFYFHHPNQGKIHMLMFYRDMQGIEVIGERRVLQFKIIRRLHLFGADYEHLNPSDMLSMEFGSQTDVQEFSRKALAVMNQCSL